MNAGPTWWCDWSYDGLFFLKLLWVTLTRTFFDGDIIEMVSQVKNNPTGVHGFPFNQELDCLLEAFVVAQHEELLVQLILIRTGVRSLNWCIVSNGLFLKEKKILNYPAKNCQIFLKVSKLCQMWSYRLENFFCFDLASVWPVWVIFQFLGSKFSCKSRPNLFGLFGPFW